MPRISYCYLSIICAENITPPSVHDVSCKPHAVWFKNGDILDVKIELQNFPKDLHYKVFLDDDTMPGTIDSSINELTINFRKILAETWKDKRVGINVSSIESGGKVLDLIVLHYNASFEHSDCIARQCTLTINSHENCTNPTGNPPSLPNPGRTDKPEVSILHKDNDIVTISCSVRVKKYDLVFLYQKQGQETPLLLKMGQHLSNLKRDEMVLAMNKTLQDSDKKHSKVYCDKQSIDNPSAEGKSKEYSVLESKDELKLFESFEAPSVTVEPTYAWFDPNSSFSFVCSGTPPVEGRKLNWYIQDMNSMDVQVPDSSSQHYGDKTNQNNFTLHLNESFHLKRLFCAEDFYLPILYPNGSSQIKRYGVRATSEVITLRLRKEEEKKVWGVILGVVLGVAAILSLAAIFVVRARRRRSEHIANDPNEENINDHSECSNENYDVTPKVTYAVLDLPESAADAAPAPDGAPTAKTPYVEIVGVYNPKK